MIKKKIFLFILVSIIVFNSNYSWAMSDIEKSNIENNVQSADSKRWIYQIVDGRLQRRLWSIADQTWLTEWMWV